MMSKSHQATREELDLLLEEYSHLRKMANEVGAEESLVDDIHSLVAYYRGMVDGLCISIRIKPASVPAGSIRTDNMIKRWSGIDPRGDEIICEEWSETDVSARGSHDHIENEHTEVRKRHEKQGCFLGKNRKVKQNVCCTSQNECCTYKECH